MVKKQNSKKVLKQKFLAENKERKQKNKIERNNNNIYPSKEMIKSSKYKNTYPFMDNQKNILKIQNLKNIKFNLSKSKYNQDKKNSIFSFYNELFGFSSNNSKRFFPYKNKIFYTIAIQNLFIILLFISLLIVNSSDNEEIEKLSFYSSEISIISTKPEIENIVVDYAYPNPKTIIISPVSSFTLILYTKSPSFCSSFSLTSFVKLSFNSESLSIFVSSIRNASYFLIYLLNASPFDVAVLNIR